MELPKFEAVRYIRATIPCRTCRGTGAGWDDGTSFIYCGHCGGKKTETTTVPDTPHNRREALSFEEIVDNHGDNRDHMSITIEVHDLNGRKFCLNQLVSGMIIRNHLGVREAIVDCLCRAADKEVWKQVDESLI